MWNPQRERFPEIITPDLPGFGLAAPPFDEPFSMSVAARAVPRHLDAHDFASCVIGGLSMGGYVAMECWRMFPERITGMILADTRAAADAPQALAGRYAAAEKIKYGGYGEYCDDLLGKLLCDTTLRQRPEVVDAVRRMMAETLPEAVVAGLYALAARPDSTETLRTITVPVLVIVGENDAITPLADAEAMCALLPNARLVVIPDAGHLSNLENPEAFNEAIASIL